MNTITTFLPANEIKASRKIGQNRHQQGEYGKKSGTAPNVISKLEGFFLQKWESDLFPSLQFYFFFTSRVKKIIQVDLHWNDGKTSPEPQTYFSVPPCTTFLPLTPCSKIETSFTSRFPLFLFLTQHQPNPPFSLSTLRNRPLAPLPRPNPAKQNTHIHTLDAKIFSSASFFPPPAPPPKFPAKKLEFLTHKNAGA